MDIAGQLHSNTSTPLANKITCLTSSALSTALTDSLSVTALKIPLYISDKPNGARMSQYRKLSDRETIVEMVSLTRDRYLPT